MILRNSTSGTYTKDCIRPTRAVSSDSSQKRNETRSEEEEMDPEARVSPSGPPLMSGQQHLSADCSGSWRRFSLEPQKAGPWFPHPASPPCRCPRPRRDRRAFESAGTAAPDTMSSFTLTKAAPRPPFHWPLFFLLLNLI